MIQWVGVIVLQWVCEIFCLVSLQDNEFMVGAPSVPLRLTYAIKTMNVLYMGRRWK